MNILKKIFLSFTLSLSSLVFTDVSLSGNVGLTSDYIWRGMTQNAGDPSISGGFDLEDDSGFYLGLWAANVSADDDDTVAGSGSLELDGYLGYSGSFNEDAGYDIGYIAYTYPNYDTGILKRFTLPSISMGLMLRMLQEWNQLMITAKLATALMLVQELSQFHMVNMTIWDPII